jgi:F0F1-type ATP synthase delta subunit
VIATFNVLTHAEKGEIFVDVEYATPITESAKDDLIKRLNKLTGKAVILREALVPSLLGGLRIIIGSTCYDATIRGQLNAVKARVH